MISSPIADLELGQRVLQELVRQIHSDTGELLDASLTQRQGEPRVLVKRGEEAFGFALRDQSNAAMTTDIADRLQDAVVDLLWTGWPMCPQGHHNHPLQARTVHHRAYWTCPADGDIVRAIQAPKDLI